MPIVIDDCDEVFLDSKNGNNNNNKHKHNHKRQQQQKLKQIVQSNKVSVTVSGHSGATLAGILPHLRSILSDSSNDNNDNDNDDDDDNDNDDDGNNNDDKNDIKSCRINQICDSGETTAAAAAAGKTTTFIVACAGENDISQGLSLERSIEQLREFLDLIFLDDYSNDNDDDNSNSNNNKDNNNNNNNSNNNNRNNNDDDHRFLIFLGPKFEPWQDNHHDNISYKKKYNSMTRAFQRCLQEYSNNNKNDNGNDNDDDDVNNSNNFSSRRRIHYIDCLTMFCDEETTNLPGARFCGRAKAEPYYFCSDQLHLSDSGYDIWKDIIETIILQLTSSSSSSS
jgi:lysophospholipase L1-like esterase